MLAAEDCDGHSKGRVRLHPTTAFESRKPSLRWSALLPGRATGLLCLQLAESHLLKTDSCCAGVDNDTSGRRSLVDLGSICMPGACPWSTVNVQIDPCACTFHTLPCCLPSYTSIHSLLGARVCRPQCSLACRGPSMLCGASMLVQWTPYLLASTSWLPGTARHTHPGKLSRVVHS